MGLTIPGPVKAYSPGQAPIAYSSNAYTEPVEGKKFMPLELQWDGNGSTFDINLSGMNLSTFTQIVMLDVDNSKNSADVTFLFPDTVDTLPVPAYESGLFPVFTKATRFYAASPLALATDETFVRVLNYRQEPVASPTAQFHNVAATGAIALAAGTTPLIGAGTSGTMEGYSIFVGAIAGAAVGNAAFQLIDHSTGALIEEAFIDLPAAGAFNGLVMNVSGINYRFKSGVDLTIVTGGTAFASGGVCASLKYRSP